MNNKWMNESIMLPWISLDSCKKTAKGVQALQVGGWLVPDIELNYFKFEIRTYQFIDNKKRMKSK